MNIPQSIEWLQSQPQKIRDYGLKPTTVEEKLLEIVNVQTGLISQLNEELLQLRHQHVEERRILQKFMDKQGFNYPP
jgi:hypothetical protein